MHFLFCCEFYYPSVGGAQEDMRQIAERMVRRGHQVTVATTQVKGRPVTLHNGVRIEHFAVAGNEARGMSGEVNRYRDFVLNFAADALLVHGAQQWTFDALFPVLDRVRMRKLFIPCGFPGLFEAAYAEYYKAMPARLRRFDRLIFHAAHYRDIDFCRQHALDRVAFIVNGADEAEFDDPEATLSFRRRHGISENSFLISTVASRKGDMKGHRELADAFIHLDTGGRDATLVLNGSDYSCEEETPSFFAPGFWGRARDLLRRTMFGSAKIVDPLAELARRAERNPRKHVLLTDLPRAGVVDLFKASDLFVFAPNIDYGAQVLIEAAAAATPFLTVPVGNAAEIAEATGGGIVCPADRDDYGYTRVVPQMLAQAIARAMGDPVKLARLGQAGRQAWERKFTWDKVALHYEALLTNAGLEPGDAFADRPAISVLLPVYNGGETLDLAVRSILSQTLKDFELLLIDDGSSDGAVDKIRALGDPRIRVMGGGERLGLAARLNQGIAAAQGRYIARMDADDISFPTRFEKQAHFLDINPDIDLVGCRAVVFRGSDNTIIGLLPFAARHHEICAQPWRGIPLPHPSWMGRAAWFRRFGYAIPDIEHAEDQELLLRSHADSRFACLGEVLLGYRRNGFVLADTLAARRHLFPAQQRYFFAHRQWKMLAANAAATAVKAAVDLLAALPGCDRLFFARMSAPVPGHVIADLERARHQP